MASRIEGKDLDLSIKEHRQMAKDPYGFNSATQAISNGLENLASSNKINSELKEGFINIEINEKLEAATGCITKEIKEMIAKSLGNSMGRDIR